MLDNTYLTRAARSHVLDAAARHGVPTRCVWLDTTLAQAQVNLVERLLDRFGVLPTPEELRAAARREPGLLLPTSQMRAQRELEPPTADEGWGEIEQRPFVRTAWPGTKPGVFVAAAALERDGFEQADAGAPTLVFDWDPGGAREATVRTLASALAGAVEVAVCPHGGGPPACWCRPPLPGLPLTFARRAGVDPARSVLIGVSPAHRTLAAALGSTYVGV